MKTEKQLTAVEWFVQQLRNGKELNDNLIQQAKEMEKEQLLAAHSDWSRITENLPTRSAVRYYYETFKSE